jgi:caspase domain-containing protein
MGRLFAVLAGCDYVGARGGLPVLAGAEADARQFAALLAAAGLPEHTLAEIVVLLGPRATRARIRAALRACLAAQTADDTLLCYFAGHGGQRADGLVLYAYDAPYPATRLLADCGPDPAPLAFVLDTCHAGAIALSESTARARLMTEFRLGQVQFLCSAAATQTAHEQAGHGVFTQTLLAALAVPRDPSLWTLPLPLDRWCTVLPPDLLAEMDYSPAATATVLSAARGQAIVPDLPGAALGGQQNWTAPAPGSGS